ncbi:MAG: trypsin-like peptidase domain-containing protein [Actinomycetales bacterium]|nr:trypsin-like peptidase domain-containing protein [Actinomycetales bacterium]
MTTPPQQFGPGPDQPGFASPYHRPGPPQSSAGQEPTAGQEPIPQYGGPDATDLGTYPYSSATASVPQGASPTTVPPRRPRIWAAVTAAAVLAAVLASGGTAALVNQESPTGSAGLPQVSGTQVSLNSTGTPDWEKAAAAARPSVVAIEFSSRAGSGAGSGVILDSAGRILTNNHVVADAQKIVVTLGDGRMYEATVVGTDATTDLAVIQLSDPPKDLTAATLGTSADLEVGQDVMAVGNPLGLDNTVTTGIISALDRPVTASDGGTDTVVTNAIQIDAAINPGNSGGPLFNAEGQVIGLTSSIASLTGSQSGSIGLGFAIPIDLATNVADQLIKNGTAEHAYLGVSLSDTTATVDGTTRAGAQVEQVMAGTPAESAGLRAGDVIIKIDDHVVGSAESLTGYVRQYASGTEAVLTVARDGKSVEVTVTLATK